MSRISAEGRRRLRDLLPWARAEARKSPIDQVTIGSSLMKVAASHVTSEDQLNSIEIYPAPLGGWHCDLVLRDMPPGVPNSVGTPVAEPLPTRADAEARAKLLLLMVLTLIAMPKEQNRDPVFMLYDWNFTLKPKILQAAIDLQPEHAGGYRSIDHAEKRISVYLELLCPNGAEQDLAHFGDWPIEAKARLLTVLHIAALTGLFVYPKREDGRPPTVSEAEQSTARH